MRLFIVMFFFVDCFIVVGQDEDVFLVRNEQLFLEFVFGVEVVIITYMEMDQLYVLFDLELLVVGKVDLFKEGYEEVKILDGEIKQIQKLEDFMWVCVEIY